MEKLNWLDDVPNEAILPVLDGDALYIAESCGLETLFSLWKGGTIKQTIRISEKSLLAVKKVYIKAHFDGSNVKDLSRLLSVTEQFVYDTLNEKRSTNQLNMFD